MAKEATEKTVAVMTEYPNRLQMSMLAPVRKMASMIEDGDREVYIVGYVFGEARGVSFRNNPNATDDAPSEALVGVFEGIPAYADMPWMADTDKCAARARLASGVCFLPQAAQSAVVKAVLGADYDRPAGIKRGKRQDMLGVTVPISVEVGIRKNKGDEGAGYEWVVRGLANIVKENPLDRMRKALGLSADADLSRIVDAADKGTALPAPKAPKKSTPAKGKRK